MKKGGVGSSNERNQEPSSAESNSSQLRVRASSGTKNGLLSSSSDPGQNGKYTYKTFDTMSGTKVGSHESGKSSKSTNSGEVQSTQVSPSESGQELKLKKELGLWNGVSIIVGVIVGSGIFVSPKGVLLYTSSWGSALLVWISCGILSTLGALCYAELGTSIPRSGGDYAYIMESFGPLPAFLFLWGAITIIMPAGNAIAALTMANYILYNFFPGCEAPENATRFIAALAVCFLTFINCYSVKWATLIQNTFSIAKVFALVIIICVGFYHMIFVSSENLTNPFKGSSFNPADIALAFYSGLFSYAGWNYLNFVTEELKDPFRNLPLAISISLPLVTLIYSLANLAYFTVLSVPQILDSNAVAVTFGDKTLGPLSITVPVAVAMSAFGGLNGAIFASSRLFFVGARGGHLPSFLSMINLSYFTPIPALLLLGLLTLAYLTTTSVYSLINYAAFIESLFVTVSVAALLWMRHKKPDLPRPIKVYTFIPYLFLIVCTFLVILPFWSEPLEPAIGLAIILAGIPVYYVTIGWDPKPDWYNGLVGSVTRFLQRLLLSVEGGKND